MEKLISKVRIKIENKKRNEDHKSNLHRKYYAYTLIEILLYVGLTSALLLTITATFGQVLEVRSENSARRTVESEARFIISKLESEITSASDVTLPADNSSGAQLSLTIPGEGTNTIFSLSGSNLVINENGGGNLQLSSDVTVSGLSFTNRTTSPAPSLIDYTFTLSKNYMGGTYTYTYVGSFTLRR